MSEIEEIGNRELAVSTLSLRLHIYHAMGLISDKDFRDDPRKLVDFSYLSKLLLSEQIDLDSEMYKACKIIFDMPIELSCLIINELSDVDKQNLALYTLVTQEINRRGFKVKGDWYPKMYHKPTYIREMDATNYLGGEIISPEICTGMTDDELNDYLFMMDYPVRKACKILNEKGYITYWSSANSIDFEDKNGAYKHDDIYVYRGEGSIVKGKRVAYILIDPNNLTDELKQELFLDGRCEFWGIALDRDDNGKYYGVWAEITSLDMRCDDLSEALVKKALALPNLENKKVPQQ